MTTITTDYERDSGLLTIQEQFKKEKTDQDKACLVHAHFKRALNARITKDHDYLEQYKIYRFHAKTRKYPWRANIYVPVGHVNIVVKVAKLLTAIMSSDPFFRPVAKNKIAVINEQNVQSIMLQQHEDMEFALVLHDWLLDMCIFGFGAVKLFWKYDEEIEEFQETIQQPVYLKYGETLEQVGTEPKIVTRKEYITTFDGPMAEVMNIFDFYVDPQATSVKNARYAIHRKDVSIDYLKQMTEKGLFKEVAVQKIVRENATATGQSSEKQSIDTIEHLEKEGENTIEILEYWTKQKIYVVGPNDTLLRERNNQFKRLPFFVFKHLRSAHRFAGIGVNEPITGVQDAINDVHNLRFDNLKLIVQKGFVVDTGAIVSPTDLVARPGMLVRGKPGYDVRKIIAELHKGTLPVEAYAEEDRLVRLSEVVTGITETVIGASDAMGGEETATKTRQTSAGITTRFGVDLLVIEPILKDFLSFQHELNMMFLDYPREIRAMGETGYEYPMIGPEQVSGLFDFKFELSPIQGNREIWLQRVLLVFNTLAKTPFLAPIVNWAALSKRLLNASDLRNPDELLNLQDIPIVPPEMLALQGALPTGEGAMQNPQQGKMNAKMRIPQPTPNDLVRDVFAGAR